MRDKMIFRGAFLLLAAGLLFLFAHVDIYPNIHTYGVSVGTNTAYCSVEWVGHITLSCQNGE